MANEATDVMVDPYNVQALTELPLEQLGDLAHAAQQIFDDRHEKLAAKRSKPAPLAAGTAKGTGKGGKGKKKGEKANEGEVEVETEVELDESDDGGEEAQAAQ